MAQEKVTRILEFSVIASNQTNWRDSLGPIALKEEIVLPQSWLRSRI